MIRYAILAILRDGSDYGYNVKKRFDETLGDCWRLNVGQVYQTLRDLERKALVVRTSATADRAREVYAVTEKGRELLDRWACRPIEYHQPLREEFLIRMLVLASARPSKALAHLDRELSVCRSHRRRLLKCLEDDVGEDSGLALRRLATQAVLLQIDARIEWLELCRTHLCGAVSESAQAAIV